MLRQLRCGVIFAFFLVVLLTGVARAQDFPSPTGFVNDYAGLLSPEGKAQLENRLVRLERETSAEVAVVTVVSLEGDSIEDYAASLFKEWGIGKKDKDNGVLFMVALTERKTRIEVGYGLEAVLTDGRAGRILDNKVLTNFREGDYEAGIIVGAIAIENYLRDGSPPTLLEENPLQHLFNEPDFIEPLMVGLGIITIYLAGFMARSKSIWLGGIWGFIVGIVLGLAWGKLAGLILFPILLTGLGLYLDYLLSRNYRELRSLGKSTGWAQTWGGFSGGGSSGGFHYGGGSSGGGGSSRGW